MRMEVAKMLRLAPIAAGPSRGAVSENTAETVDSPSTIKEVGLVDTPWPGDETMTELPWPEDESTPPEDRKCFNFYTRSLIRKRDGRKEIVNLDKTLIDGGATVNLIPMWVATAAKFGLLEDPTLSMKTADGKITKLPTFARFNIRIAGVDRIIDAYTVEGVTAYSLLLGRNWMRSVGLRGDYSRDTYYIDTTGEGAWRELQATIPRHPIPIPKVFVTQGQEPYVRPHNRHLLTASIDYDEKDIDYELEEVERECNEEQEDSEGSVYDSCSEDADQLLKDTRS
jgi:hypothetical protein